MSRLLAWINKNDKIAKKDAIVYRENNTSKYLSISYEKLYEYIISLSGYLQPYKRSTVAIIGNNKLEFVVSLLAVLCNIGNAFVIDKELKEDDINKIFTIVHPDLIILDDDIDFKCNDIETIYFTTILKEMKENHRFEIDDSFSGSLILHTSGTTGEPKCILLEEEKYLYIIKNLNDSWKVNSNHSCLFIIPLYHIYALTSLFHGLYAGVSNILEYDYSKLDLVLKETHPSIFLGVPLIFNKVKNKAYKTAGFKLRFGIVVSNILRKFNIDIRKKLFSDLHNYFGGNFYFAVSGGSIADPETNKFFNDVGLFVYNGYGMTETSGPVAICYQDNNEYDSVGKILNNDVKIINKDENGIGEILIKGPNIITCYIKNMDSDKFIDGYFNTEDLGYVKNGFLYVTGRKKDILIGDNGKNISPKEIIEKVLRNKEIYDCTIKMEENKLIAIIDTSLSQYELNKYILKINESLPNYKKISSFKIIRKGFNDGDN